MAERTDPDRRRIAWLLAAIVVVAAILRLAGLSHFPPGLSVDEAYNLIDARRILAGDRPLFLPDNAGREALYSYWQAVVIGLLGATPFALRVASALIGIVTVPVSYWCLRALPWRYARLTALVAAALLAVLFWHVVFSRFGIRAISLPLVTALLFGWLWRGMARDRVSLYALAGVALGVALYTGTAARVLPLAPIAMCLWLAWADRPRARSYLRGLALVLGVAVLVALPLAAYFAQRPQQFTTHLGEVAIGPAEILTNLARVLAMFNLYGDIAWWRNLAGRPAFDPLVGILFLVGVALVVREGWRGRRPTTDDRRPTLTDVGTGFPRPDLQEGRETLPLPSSPVVSPVVGGRWSVVPPATAAIFTLVWLVTMLLPTIAADNAPNFSRAIGILPVALVFPARALVLGWVRLRPRRPRLATPLLVGALLVSLAWTTWDYFVIFANRPETYYAYDADKVAAGRFLRAEAAARAVFAAPLLAGHATVRAVTDGVDVRRFDPARGLVLPDGAATYATWAQPARSGDTSPPFGLERLAASRETVADDQGRPLLTVYRLGRTEPNDVRAALGLRPGQARFGNRIGLSGVALTPGDATHGPGVTLMWTALAPLLDRNLTVFAHFVDASGRTVAQADGEPLGATYPTSEWRVGDRVIEERGVAPLPPGTYRVRVGWYDRATGERLPLPGSADNAFDAGMVEVKG
ncbi:MAG: hypothetical protein KIS91_10620 [Anaerolineae bacterium]|nr:hypothetical protein [Anaerolineae bacterium]